MNKKVLCVVVVMMLIASLMAGCGTTGGTTDSATEESAETVSVSDTTTEDTGETESESYSIAFFPNTMNNTFHVAINDTLKAACDERGWSLMTYDPDYDTARQLSQMADAANQGYDAIVFIPVDPAGSREGLLAFTEKGIPVICIDTALVDEDLELCASFITTDCYQAGVLMGEELVKKYPDGAKIAILDFPPSTTCVDRVDGFLEGLGDLEKYEIVAQQNGKATIDASMPAAQDIIQAHPDVKAFFCINDPSALGAAAGIEAAGMTGEIDLYSIDASPAGKEALIDGSFTAVTCQVPIKEAEKAVEQIEILFSGDTITETFSALEPWVVTLEEAKETVGGWQ